MVKRVASVVLWFIATGWAFNYLSLLVSVPPLLGLVLAGAVSAFVGLDPLHVVWPVREDALAPRMVHTDVPQVAIHSNM